MSSPPPTPVRPSRTGAWALLASVAAGALAAVQAGVNGALAERSGSDVHAGAAAALVSLGSGLLVLSVLCLHRAVGPGVRRIGSALRSRALRPWHVAGGVAGALVLLGQGITVGTIGVALFTVALVAGQSGSALAVDRAGLGPAGVQHISAHRAVGTLLTVAAVVLAVVGGGAAPGSPRGATLALVLLPLVGGAAVAWQQAVNGRVGAVGGPVAAAWVNFLGGTVIVAAVVGVLALVPGQGVRLPSPLGGSWWLYTGGVLGVVIVATSVLVVRVLGVLLLGLGLVAGQVLAATALDVLSPAADVGPVTVLGAALTLLGVAVAAGLPRRHAAP